MEGTKPKLGFWAIVVIAANTMNGPGLTVLPTIASSAGLLTFCLLCILATCVTSFVVKRLSDLMFSQKLYQNPLTLHLKEADLVALSDQLFQKKKEASIAMVCCALSLALAQMMLCAAIADSMFVAAFGRSCGLGMTREMHCTEDMSMKPFQALELAPSLLSYGLVTSASITILLSAVDLESMLTAQYVLFGCLILASCRFCNTLKNMGMTTEEDTVKPKPDFFVGRRPFDAIGPILFNFAFVVTAPPLVVGAGNAISATRALVAACVIMGMLYIGIGWIGASAATNTQQGFDDNLLSLVLRGTSDALNPLDILAVSLFGLSQLAAIPVYCELARETLVEHVSIPRTRAFVLSVVFPWVICALTYNSSLFEAFVEWSSLLLLGFANFSLPLILDHKHQTQETVLHHPAPGTGLGAVIWSFALITASITAVIIQRITNSYGMAEGAFMVTVLAILHFH